MLKSLIKRALFGAKASSETYIAELKRIGVSIGEDVTIYVPSKTLIDEQYPWMISIGNHVRIAQGVTILTHDYSWSVNKTLTGEILGASGKVTIGNNVFIGMNATILRGVKVQDNVIIGSGAVVTKDCLMNGIYAGNPARRIAELSDFISKRRAVQKREAKELAVTYFERYGVLPPENVFHEYFMLFLDEDEIAKREWCLEKLKLCGNIDESLCFIDQYDRPFNDYKSFLSYCFENSY